MLIGVKYASLLSPGLLAPSDPVLLYLNAGLTVKRGQSRSVSSTRYTYISLVNESFDFFEMGHALPCSSRLLKVTGTRYVEPIS